MCEFEVVEEMALFLCKDVDKIYKAKGEAPMKMDLPVTEIVELINQIRHEPGNLFEMIRTNVQETVGQYRSQLMDLELTEFLGRGRYERGEGDPDHRNSSYPRKFTLKGVSSVGVRITGYLKKRLGDQFRYYRLAYNGFCLPSHFSTALY